MLVNTYRLFTTLLSCLEVDSICDVGSMDGSEALRFAAVNPHATVYAFEPNPHNLRLMHSRQEYFRQRNIHLVPLAASDQDGVAELFLVAADYSRGDIRRGMSSLHRRVTGEWASATAVSVRTTRLDTFIAGSCAPAARLALWIDTEGAAYEAIAGLTRTAHQVQLLHVEVETVPCIGARQRLYPEVRELLQRLGFLELATDLPRGKEQFNALFVRARLPGRARLRIFAALARARLRYLLGGALWGVCPGCARRHARARARAT
jgi:2-O-methyltransferase